MVLRLKARKSRSPPGLARTPPSRLINLHDPRKWPCNVPGIPRLSSRRCPANPCARWAPVPSGSLCWQSLGACPVAAGLDASPARIECWDNPGPQTNPVVGVDRRRARPARELARARASSPGPLFCIAIRIRRPRIGVPVMDPGAREAPIQSGRWSSPCSGFRSALERGKYPAPRRRKMRRKASIPGAGRRITV